MRSALAVLALALFAASAASAEPQRRKTIAIGHELYEVAVDDVLAAGSAFRQVPLDGIAIPLMLKVGDRTRASSRVTDAPEGWTAEALAGQIAAMRRVTPETGLTDNFIYAFRHPTKRIDWADGARWAQIAAALRVFAAACRDGGFKGFVIDPEDYARQGQFERRSTDLPYDELAPLVRRRAGELFRGVFAEYPEITVFSYWLMSFNRDFAAAADPQAAARERGDLWPAFVNGLLDVAPLTAKLVDGCEHAYRFRADSNDFHVSASQQRRGIGLVAPENRVKARAILQVGFGLWLGMYLKTEDRPYTKDVQKWIFENPRPSRPGFLAANLSQALFAADEYVWLYTASERTAWVRWRSGRGSKWPTWGERFPDIVRALAIARDPNGWMDARIKALGGADGLTNLVNAAGKAKLPSDDLAAGTKPDYRAYSVRDVRAGEVYGIRAVISGDDVQPIVRWRKGDAAQRPTTIPPVPVSFAEPYAGRPRAVRGCVLVPEGVDKLDFVVRALPSKTPVRVEEVAIWRLESFVGEESERMKQ